MEKLILTKPILINGAEVKEISYDFDEFTAKDKINAGKRYKKDGGMISVQELDSDYHLYIFAEAAAKVDNSIDISDIFRMNAKDGAKAESLVRDFFFINVEDMSQLSTSEE